MTALKISRWYHPGMDIYPLYLITVVLIRERQTEIWAIDTEMKVMWRQSQRLELYGPNPRSPWNPWNLEEAGRDSLESSGRLQPCWPPDFLDFCLQNYKKIHFYCFKPLGVVICYTGLDTSRKIFLPCETVGTEREELCLLTAEPAT